MNRHSPILASCGFLLLILAGCMNQKKETIVQAMGEEARHLRNIRQLTFGGENAEAYFSFDDRKLIFQSTRDGRKADQIYTMRVDGRKARLVSTGKGRTTCSFYYPDGKRFLYASTHLAGAEPPEALRVINGKYVWAIHKSYDIFSARPDGSEFKRLTSTDGYDAEATISRDGKVVFTSARDGDLEIYTMNLDGSEQKRLTFEKGYDGGPFFSADGKKIVYRAHHPKKKEEVDVYQKFLNMGYVQPTRMEIFIIGADGRNRRQLTNNGKANFCPFFHPSGKKIIFASNSDPSNSRNFELYTINIDGTGMERITYNPTFDGFPMFSSNGNRLVFASNRNAKVRGETNIFVADWVD